MGILLTYTPRLLLLVCLLCTAARSLPAQWRQSSAMAELYGLAVDAPHDAPHTLTSKRYSCADAFDS